MLVGDVLLSAREAVPDLPGTLPAPQSTAEIAIAGAVIANGNLANGAYYVLATYSTLWGETSVGPEASLTLSSYPNNGITVDVSGCPYLPLVAAINVYLGRGPGLEIQKYTFSQPLAGPYTIVLTTSYALSPPPQGNSAFLLDSGGPVASASQIFRWLSDCLNTLSSLNGGIPDQGGFATQIGKANYVMPGDWQSLTNAWYDGYPLNMGSSALVFRHNTITALAGMMNFTQVSDRLVVELFAQPVRTAGVTSLSAPMSVTDTIAQTQGLTGFVLPFGLVQIGTEIVSWTGSGNNLISLVRGLGGTSPQAWGNGTPVIELNCHFSGMRAAQLYTPGMAASTLTVPSDWTPLLHLYLLARYREVEQQGEDAERLMKRFMSGALEATKQKPVIGDRQIQPQDSVGVEVWPLLSHDFGGAIIP